MGTISRTIKKIRRSKILLERVERDLDKLRIALKNNSQCKKDEGYPNTYLETRSKAVESNKRHEDCGCGNHADTLSTKREPHYFIEDVNPTEDTLPILPEIAKNIKCVDNGEYQKDYEDRKKEEIEDKIKKIETKLMGIGISGFAYSYVWNKLANKKSKLEEELKKANYEKCKHQKENEVYNTLTKNERKVDNIKARKGYGRSYGYSKQNKKAPERKGCEQLFDFNAKVCGRDGLCDECENYYSSQDKSEPRSWKW